MNGHPAGVCCCSCDLLMGGGNPTHKPDVTSLQREGEELSLLSCGLQSDWPGSDAGGDGRGRFKCVSVGRSSVGIGRNSVGK